MLYLFLLLKERLKNMEDELKERLMMIEMAIANQERVVEDLNQMVIEQGKIISALQKQNRFLLNRMGEESVKPLSEETPPPHY